MTGWLRRIRGAVGMGLTRAGLWAAMGALVALLPGTMSAPYPIPFEFLVGFAAQGAAQFAALGFVGGATFSLVVRAIEGRRRFDQMSLPRFAAWGGVGGLMIWAARGLIGASEMGLVGSVGLPGPTWVFGIPGGIIVLLGAGSAAGTLALARRADGREALERGEGVAEFELTDDEVPQLAYAPRYGDL